MSGHPYERPELYDLAFSWRDYSKAADFIAEAARLAGVGEIRGMVELGCGPGQYCREFARRGIESIGVDCSPEMALYAQQLYDRDDLPGYVLEADMRNFDLERPVELAVCMMATFSLLISNDDVVAHLRAVGRNLTPGGVYVIELPHPRDVYNSGSSTKNVWQMEKDGGTLHIDWSSDAKFDPLTEISRGNVRFRWEKDDQIDEYVAPEAFRGYGQGLFRALVELSGCFEVSHLYGDLDTKVPFDNSKKAWRMLAVLRKTNR